MHKIKKKEESRKRIFGNAQRENGEAQLHMTTWAKHHRRRVPGLATSPPRKGGGQASQPRCARTLGASAPNATQPGCSLCRRLHASMLRLFWVVFVFTCAEPSYIHYLRRGEAHLTTTHHLEPYLTTTSCSLFLSFSSNLLEQGKLLGELVSLGE